MDCNFAEQTRQTNSYCDLFRLQICPQIIHCWGEPGKKYCKKSKIQSKAQLDVSYSHPIDVHTDSKPYNETLIQKYFTELPLLCLSTHILLLIPYPSSPTLFNPSIIVNLDTRSHLLFIFTPVYLLLPYLGILLEVQQSSFTSSE